MKTDKSIQLGKGLLLLGAVLLCIVFNVPTKVFAQTSGPDIIVQSILFEPPNPAPGEPVNIIVEITNIGDVAGTGGRAYIYVNPADNPPTDATPFTDEAGFNIPLLPGRTFQLTAIGEVFNAEGVYPVWVRVDVEDATDETDETNNLTGPIDLIVGNPPEATVDTDTCLNPYLLQVNQPPLSHALVATEDVDFFSVDLVADVNYRISALLDDPDGPGRLNLDVALADANPDCDGGNFGTSAEMAFEAPLTGTYIISVLSSDGVYGSDVAYGIQVTTDQGGGEPTEPSDFCEQAHTLIVGDTPQSQALGLNDEDWYEFSVMAGREYELLIDVDDTTIARPKVDLELECEPDPNSYNPGQDVSLAITGHADTTYYARVYAPGREVGDYTITVANIVSPQFDLPPDTDGDGIPDDIEINGWDYDGDGQIDVDLAALGADPNHKDVFIEIDYMVDGDFSYRPDPNSIQIVVASFHNAPVENPDGTTGIHLHVDYGEDAPLTWRGGQAWGDLSRSSELPYSEHIGNCNPSFDWTDFDAIKNVNFMEAREPIFHYNVWGHDLCPLNEGAGGLSRNDDKSRTAFRAGASDFLITLGPWIDGGLPTLPAKDIGGVFMHELGHNLGLMHGGTDHKNFKPNYFSVMNYFFTSSGLNVNGQWEYYDYSRTENMTLDEASLDEPIGLNLDNSDVTATLFVCDGLVYGFPTYAVEWNCDGDTADADVEMDINGDGRIDILTTQNDWDNLSYIGGLIGDFYTAGSFSVLSPLPFHTEPDELNICIIQNGLPQNGVDGRNILVDCPPDPTNTPPQFDTDVITLNADVNFYVTRMITDISDSDNDRLVYRGLDLPLGIRVHAGQGEIYGVPEVAGTFTSTITAIDGRGGEATQTIIWQLTQPLPTLISLTHQTVTTQLRTVVISISLILLLGVTLRIESRKR